MPETGRQDQIRILAVDDNADALFALKELLVKHGFEALTAGDGKEALALLEQENIDLVLLDVVMPGLSGVEVAREIKSHPQLRYIPVALLTANDTLEDIVRGFEAGANDYIVKPYRPDELIARVQAALRTKRLYAELKSAEAETRELRGVARARSSYANIIGQSAAMQQVFSLIDKVKDADVPVLIGGESGTGKELVASAIHYNGKRQSKPFVVQNCSAFNENLLESELFGHMRGAFTGAVRDKEGLFEVADGGTFFLDELGEMSQALQVKLLRVLQDGTFMPVGGTKLKEVDVRIVAATNRNLRQMVQDGTFREDLYYRLNVVNIKLPSLRERLSDIPELASHFLAKIAAKNKTAAKTLSKEALSALSSYAWPGNIRELENEIERLLLMAGDSSSIGLDLISSHIKEQQSSIKETAPVGSLKEALDDLERRMIVTTLKRLNGNKSEAARVLGVSRSNLIAKVQSYGIEQEDEE